MSLSGTQSDHSDGFITSFIFESKKLGKHLENTEVLLGVGQFDYQPCQSSRGVERVGPAMKERVAYPLMLRIVDFGQGSLNGTHFGGIKHIVYYIYIYIFEGYLFSSVLFGLVSYNDLCWWCLIFENDLIES